MAFLADVNFLVALLHAGHAHAPTALSWLERHDGRRSILICRVAQMGMLRVLTNPRWLKADVQPAGRVWEAWDGLLDDDRFARVEEPAQLEATWRELTGGFPLGRCAETDTYLAAFARAGGHRLLTFDRGFGEFPGLEVELLS